MNIDSQELERIVAYLDGELSATESAQVEQRLATDEQFRQELQGAERTWAALDELPLTQVDNAFARTTMEMVVEAARQDVEAKTLALPIQQKQSRYRSLFLMVMAALLGAVMFRAFAENPGKQLQADLLVIQHVDIYSQFQGIEFLEELHRLLGDSLKIVPAQKAQLEIDQKEFELLSVSSKRQDWLAELPKSQQATLRAKYNRFLELSPQRQADLRELHQQIEASADREQLLQTMFRYQQWLSERPQSEQYTYRELAELERAKQVATKMIKDAKQQRFELTTKQLRELHAAVQPYILEIIQEHQVDRNKGAMPGRARRPPHDHRHFRKPLKPEQAARMLRVAMRNSPEKMKDLNDAIVEALPEEMKPAFQELPLHKKISQFHGWMRQARAHRLKDLRSHDGRRSGEIPEVELLRYFTDELDVAVREKLLALPRDQMRQQLERWYRGQEAEHEHPLREHHGMDDRPPHLRGRQGDH